MSKLIEGLASNPAVVAAAGRDEKEFFGQGWSHYPETFRATAGEGVRVACFVYNTPNRKQVNWSLKDPGVESGYPQWPLGVNWTGFALTPEESRALATELGLDISAWLDAALAACASDTTVETMARMGNAVDAANFHANRAGD